MTNEEAERIYNEMVDMFGDNLPDPDHYPKTFAYFVKLYKYLKAKQ